MDLTVFSFINTVDTVFFNCIWGEISLQCQRLKGMPLSSG